MKIFGWMPSKLYGRHDNKKSNSISVDYHSRQESRKEEFSDWPHELLAIGTFGNNSVKEESKHNRLREYPSFSQNLPQDVTVPEEVGKLQNELSILLHKKGGSTDNGAESETANYFNSQTSLEDDRTNSEQGCSDESDNKDCYLQANTSTVAPSRRKDMCADTNTAINKKTLSFLLKKMFICGRGFTPAPSLKNQVPESGIEKILRTILRKKIYPQNPSPTSTTKKYLENKQKPKSVGDDETNEKADDGSKWVKTDSEYIVLEI